MKQNEQKEHRDAKEHCVSYCGSLCNPGDAFIRKASVFPAAQMFMYHGCFSTLTCTGRTASLVTLYFRHILFEFHYSFEILYVWESSFSLSKEF